MSTGDRARSRLQPVERWQEGQGSAGEEPLAEEVAVALCYNGISYAVMMATPQDLEDFALGFSLSEGIITGPGELYEVTQRHHPRGIELDMGIAARQAHRLKERRRNLAGRTGCGLCGTQTLAEARMPVPRVSPAPAPSDRAIQRARDLLGAHQPLQNATGAVHAAAWCDSEGAILAVCEDVGRHNALDKLLGVLCRRQIPTRSGFVLMSSRASYELVHKSAMRNIANLVTFSAPTALAVELACEAGIHLVGFVRSGRHTRYTGPCV